MKEGQKRMGGDVLSFMRALWALDHALRSASKHMNHRLGVTGPQRLVIRMVGKYPGIDAGVLAEMLHLHPSTLTGIVARLEKGRYLSRSVDPEDARRIRFRLTAKGEGMDQIRTGTVEASLRRALGALSRDHIRITREVLETLAVEIGKPHRLRDVGTRSRKSPSPVRDHPHPGKPRSHRSRSASA